MGIGGSCSIILLVLITQVACKICHYIIVGGGTSGLALANRLSGDSEVFVTVIEPGGDERDNMLVTDTLGFTKAFGTPIDWNYNTTAQKWALNRTIPWHAGKALGGTSTINGMTYIRADKAQIDAWEELGNSGWNWKELFTYYFNSENFTFPDRDQYEAGALFRPSVHGAGGHVNVAFSNTLNNSIHYGMQEWTWHLMGLNANEDINSGSTNGFTAWPQTIDKFNNVRADSARNYYHPAEKRSNLKIIRGTVKKINWAEADEADSDGLLASGVEYVTPDGEVKQVDAIREVILCAGTLRTPLVLESSGIGNPRILKRLGIEERIALPGVGEHMQDQPNMILAYTNATNVKGNAPYAAFLTAENLFGAEVQTVAAKTSAQLSAWAQKIADASEGGVEAASLEKIFKIQHGLVFGKNVTLGEALTCFVGPVYVSSAWNLLPFSSGSVHLGSVDDIDNPIIDPRYFMIDFDLEVQTKLARKVQTFWHTHPIGTVGQGYLRMQDTMAPNGTDEALEKFILNSFHPNHHAIGTAAMMSRQLGGVVDPWMKVYGTRNVRVVDASVIPMQISGHPTATLYAMAERAASFIWKEEDDKEDESDK